MCDFHIFIAIFDDISPFHHFDHFFVNFFSCGVWGGCGGVAGLHRKVFVSGKHCYTRYTLYPKTSQNCTLYTVHCTLYTVH